MRLHILGICGTFMSGLALLAKQKGFEVTGSDMNVYPPMSTQLAKLGIPLMEGYDPAHVKDKDCVIVGNVIKRGNPAIEYVLANHIPFKSGPAWLAEHILQDQWVLAVAGTHGKTTTASLLAWILEYAGFAPGFLIGGVPENFNVSARLGEKPYFVIEADEYDSAFFDKRSKFIHYLPKTLILNNLEYDHADIFPDLEAIKLQFHYLLRTISESGLIICHGQDENLKDLLKRGCWTPVTYFDCEHGEWRAELSNSDGSAFTVFRNGELVGSVCWSLLGQHNVRNALAALAAAAHVGVPIGDALMAMSQFKNVKRRMEMRGCVQEISIYDDFAHHPTAIATTLQGLRAKIGRDRLIAVLEFGSYTMRTGVHKQTIKSALAAADWIICKSPNNEWGLKQVLADFDKPAQIYDDVESIVSNLVPALKSGDHVVVMSNSGFGGIHQKLITALENR